MTKTAMLALLAGTAPLIALTQLDAQPMTNNMAGNMANTSNSASTANESTDANVPPGPDMAPNTTDDAPPK